MKRLLLALFLVPTLLAGSVHAADLTVSAAASLNEAFTELAPLFEKSRPGVKPAYNFAASGPLLKQIEQGAPVDVFASADQKTMDEAAGKKLIDPATRTTFAKNALVLAVPVANKAKIAGLADLAGAGVARLAVGNPETVPAGRYAKAALTKSGDWDKLASKFILAESVRQVLDYLARGEVEAGFVYATDAATVKDKVMVVAEIPLETPVAYPAAVVAASKNAEAAKAFVAFLVSPEAGAVLAKWGFAAP